MTMFFKLGDKVTKGDPKRKANFDYAMLWVMFLAFISIFLSSFINGLNLIKTELWAGIRSFAWSLVMLAIVWFQYWALKQTRLMRANMQSVKFIDKKVKTKPIKAESVKEMMGEFKDE